VSIATCAGDAPFCGANTVAASMNVVRTSHATRTSADRMRAGLRSASIAPRPPSVVAEPPRPISTERAPCCRAWSISSPVPRVEAVSGSLPSAPPASSSPLARAISITAVRWCIRHAASTVPPSGPVTTAVRFGPPSTSSSPSPPSDIGASSTSRASSQHASATARHASAAVAVPRNLSIAIRTLTARTIEDASDTKSGPVLDP
jgi:hypothetical protein